MKTLTSRSEIPKGYCTYDQAGIPSDHGAAGLCSAASIFTKQKGEEIYYLRTAFGFKTTGEPMYRTLVVLPRWSFEKAIIRKKVKETKKQNTCPTCGKIL